ncbi:MAG TPA: exo-alpha-sialidase [Sedimentisphaerales bacterium]|nr:exo-alpha-sialidase [Sedimentisphaerales bacterium]
MKARVILMTVSFVVCFAVLAGAEAKQEGKLKPGLAGTFFQGEDFTRPEDETEIDVLDSVDNDWGSDRGNDWSGRWAGFIDGPFTGEVRFTARATDGLRLIIGDTVVIDGLDPSGPRTGKTVMEKAKKTPVILEFTSAHGEAQLHLYWEWPGQGRIIVPSEALSHDPAKLPDTTKSPVLAVKKPGRAGEVAPEAAGVVGIKHVIVYGEPGRFAGWPANNGVWIWGNEILVGFSQGYYKANERGHSIDNDRPHSNVLGRSLDGGQTWTVEDPENFVGDEGLEEMPSPGNIDFASPDFAMRVTDGKFFISYDRGKTWKGPYKFPDFGTDRLTSRTDYIVNGRNDCLLFLSAKESKVEAGIQDRAFCARTTDGGKTFKFLSWMTGEPITVRSVMPSTVRISEKELVSAMRRRHDIKRSDAPDTTKNWIDVYQSKDNGQSWEFLSKVADTDTGRRNGNPPSMVRLRDGRVCVTYGYRGEPCGIRARISADNGKTWGPEIHLRDDGRTWDMGYTRSVQRPDGKIVTIYYYTTNERPEQHIVATIWDPDKVK